MTEFAKYIADGAYHWDAASPSLKKHVAFTSGRYEAVMRQNVKWQGSTVLDIATGDARLAAYAADAGARLIVGIDQSRIGIMAGKDRWLRETRYCFARRVRSGGWMCSPHRRPIGGYCDRQ